MKPFTFFLDFIIASQFAGLCWAQRKGLYARAGLDVNLCASLADEDSSLDKVMAGGICAGSSEDNLIATANAVGKGVKVLAAMLQETPLVIMTKRSSGIRSLADLRGKRVAMHADGIQVLKAVLGLEGVDLASVDISEVSFDLDRLLHNEFDCVQGYGMTESVLLAARGAEPHIIPVRHHNLHPYAQVFFASELCIEQAPDILRAFLEVSFEGWRQAMNHRDETARIIVEMSDGPTNWDFERQVLEALVPYVTGMLGLEQFGMLEGERWERNLESYARFEITPRRLAFREVVDGRFLTEIYREAGL